MSLIGVYSNTTAVKADILKGKTAYTASGLTTGTMVDVKNDTAKSVYYNTSTGKVKIAMTSGAHVTKDTEGQASYPVVLASQASIASAIGLTSEMVRYRRMVLGVSGSYIPGIAMITQGLNKNFIIAETVAKNKVFDASFTLVEKPIIAYVKIITYGDEKSPSTSYGIFHGSEYNYIKVSQGESLTTWTVRYTSTDNPIYLCRVYITLDGTNLTVKFERVAGASSWWYTFKILSVDIIYEV